MDNSFDSIAILAIIKAKVEQQNKSTSTHLNLHKSEVIELMARDCETSSAQAERFLNSFFFLIYSTLSQGGEVNISGFGKPAKTGRNIHSNAS